MALNPVAKKWVAALRSGKYKQGKGMLLTDDGKYCCLGVLTDLAVRAGVLKKFRGDRDAGSMPDTVLCKKVSKWAGLSDENGTYQEENNLACMNDRGTKFSTIAKIIESKPEGLFKK